MGKDKVAGWMGGGGLDRSGWVKWRLMVDGVEEFGVGVITISGPAFAKQQLSK